MTLSKHDQKVREVAEKFKEKGWKVSADIPGFPQPVTFEGCKPDIVAKNGERTIIGEIETPASARTDKEQQKCLAAAARALKNGEYKQWVTK